ncbi:uncharacterized protein [Porites lutea]|uniref:uncharacterized protein isoform X2 n=1 Tax=Porites lutea TaxID=51062 RepID=UPI003CC66AE9
MKSPEVLSFALATLSVMECYESADYFERMEDPGVAEHDSRYMADYFEPRKEDPGVAKHNGQYMDFPRELDEEEDDDGNVENVEETFDMDNFELNSRKFSEQEFQSLDRGEFINERKIL